MADGKVLLEVSVEGKNVKVVQRQVEGVTEAVNDNTNAQGRNSRAARQNADAAKAAGDSHAHFDRGLKGSGGSSSNVTKNFSKMRDAMGGSSGLVGAYATLAANLFAATAAFGALQKAAGVELLTEGLTALGTSSGIAMGSLSKNLQAATGYAISLQDAMKSVTMVTSAGFDPSVVERLGKVAKNTSIALGRDLQDSLNRVVKGATKLEPELLDELGIMVRIDEATQKYAMQMGKSATSLTNFEKRQAFMNAVLEEGEKKFGALGGSVDANPYDKLSASLQELSTAALNLFNVFLKPFVGLLAENKLALVGFIAILSKGVINSALPIFANMTKNAAATADELGKIAFKSDASSAKRVDEAKSKLKGLKEGGLKGFGSFGKEYNNEIISAKSVNEFKAIDDKLTATIASRQANIDKSKTLYSLEAVALSQGRALTEEEKQLVAAKSGRIIKDIDAAEVRIELLREEQLALRAVIDAEKTRSKARFGSGTGVPAPVAIGRAKAASRMANVLSSLDLDPSIANYKKQTKRVLAINSRFTKSMEGNESAAAGVAGKIPILGNALGKGAIAFQNFGRIGSVALKGLFTAIPFIGQLAFILGTLYEAFQALYGIFRSDSSKKNEEQIGKLIETYKELKDNSAEVNKAISGVSSSIVKQTEKITAQYNIITTANAEFKKSFETATDAGDYSDLIKETESLISSNYALKTAFDEKIKAELAGNKISSLSNKDRAKFLKDFLLQQEKGITAQRSFTDAAKETGIEIAKYYNTLISSTPLDKVIEAFDNLGKSQISLAKDGSYAETKFVSLSALLENLGDQSVAIMGLSELGKSYNELTKKTDAYRGVTVGLKESLSSVGTTGWFVDTTKTAASLNVLVEKLNEELVKTGNAKLPLIKGGTMRQVRDGVEDVLNTLKKYPEVTAQFEKEQTKLAEVTIQMSARLLESELNYRVINSLMRDKLVLTRELNDLQLIESRTSLLNNEQLKERFVLQIKINKAQQDVNNKTLFELGQALNNENISTSTRNKLLEAQNNLLSDNLKLKIDINTIEDQKDVKFAENTLKNIEEVSKFEKANLDILQERANIEKSNLDKKEKLLNIQTSISNLEAGGTGEVNVFQQLSNLKKFEKEKKDNVNYELSIKLKIIDLEARIAKQQLEVTKAQLTLLIAQENARLTAVESVLPNVPEANLSSARGSINVAEASLSPGTKKLFESIATINEDNRVGFKDLINSLKMAQSVEGDSSVIRTAQQLQTILENGSNSGVDIEVIQDGIYRAFNTLDFSAALETSSPTADSSGTEVTAALSTTTTAIYALTDAINNVPPAALTAATGGRIAVGAVYAATGGKLSGPGGPRDDKIPAMLSNGEFVVNAKDAQKNLPILQAINSGKQTGYFAGGTPAPRRFVLTHYRRELASIKKQIPKFLSGLVIDLIPGVSQLANVMGMASAVKDPMHTKSLKALIEEVVTNPKLLDALATKGVGWSPKLAGTILAGAGITASPVALDLYGSWELGQLIGNLLNEHTGIQALLASSIDKVTGLAPPDAVDMDKNTFYGGRKDGGVIQAATGGKLSGPGGPRDDKIPAMLSNGEFVVNAKDAQKNLPILQAINSGKQTGYFADGEQGKSAAGSSAANVVNINARNVSVAAAKNITPPEKAPAPTLDKINSLATYTRDLNLGQEIREINDIFQDFLNSGNTEELITAIERSSLENKNAVVSSIKTLQQKDNQLKVRSNLAAENTANLKTANESGDETAIAGAQIASEGNKKQLEKLFSGIFTTIYADTIKKVRTQNAAAAAAARAKRLTPATAAPATGATAANGSPVDISALEKTLNDLKAVNFDFNTIAKKYGEIVQADIDNAENKQKILELEQKVREKIVANTIDQIQFEMDAYQNLFDIQNKINASKNEILDRQKQIDENNYKIQNFIRSGKYEVTAQETIELEQKNYNKKVQFIIEEQNRKKQTIELEYNLLAAKMAFEKLQMQNTFVRLKGETESQVALADEVIKTNQGIITTETKKGPKADNTVITEAQSRITEATASKTAGKAALEALPKTKAALEALYVDIFKLIPTSKDEALKALEVGTKAELSNLKDQFLSILTSTFDGFKPVITATIETILPEAGEMFDPTKLVSNASTAYKSVVQSTVMTAKETFDAMSTKEQGSTRGQSLDQINKLEENKKTVQGRLATETDTGKRADLEAQIQGFSESQTAIAENDPFTKIRGGIASASIALAPFIESLKSLGPDGELVAAIASGTLVMADSMTKFSESSKTAADKFALVASVVSSVASIISAASAAKIAGIDSEIDAEKKRDGKSKESLARIASLEKQKESAKKKAFQINKKMMIATTIMNTAAAAMAAWAPPPVGTGPLFGGALSAMIVGIGAAQLAIISGMSYEGGGGGGGASVPSTVSVGQRKSSIDMAKSQSASGELSYLQGDKGIGGPENFRPAFIGSRAAGGRVNAGYMVGEQGPELFVPKIPGRIVPADKVNNAPAQNVNISISALDASGVEDVLIKQRGHIIGMIREAANSYGEKFLESVDTRVYTQPSTGYNGVAKA